MVLHFFRRHVVAIVALGLILGSYALARPPVPDRAHLDALGARYAFVGVSLATVGELEPRSIRGVHPSLDHIAGWISSVGASVAVHDLDGDSYDDDVCLVDPRFDSISVQQAPGLEGGATARTYEPFLLPVPASADDPSTIAPMGCLAGDLDANGLPDLLVYFWGRTPVAYLQRAGTRTTGLDADAFRPVELVPGGGRWFTNAATRADVDGDGHLDLIVGNYFQDEARILDPAADGREEMQDSMSRARNAGRSRLLLWAPSEPSLDALGGGRDEPTVRFVDVTDEALDDPVAHGWTLAIGAADLDGDQLPEIYLAQDFGPDAMLHNRSTPGEPKLVAVVGRRGPATPASKIIGRDSFKGMGVDFGDLDADGHLDLFVSNIAQEYALEESHFAFISTGEVEAWAEGRAPYVDRSEELGLARSGWSWETKLADFDNDGVLEAVQATGFVRGTVNRWPELHEVAMGNDQLLRDPRAWPRVKAGDDLSGNLHNYFFARTDPTARFVDVAPRIGLGAPQVTRGIALADLDRDGDLDMVVANQWDTSFVYRNDAPRPGEHLALSLLLPLEPGASTTVLDTVPSASAVRARPAIGASATVHLLGHPDDDARRLTAQVDGGNGHSGSRSPRLHFGLGDVAPDEPLPVEIVWRAPDGAVHSERFELAPGAHTLLLGWGEVSPSPIAAATTNTEPSARTTGVATVAASRS